MNLKTIKLAFPQNYNHRLYECVNACATVLHIIYLFSLFLTPLFQESGYPDAKDSAK